MNEAEARMILGTMIRDDNGLEHLGLYISWSIGDASLVLDGEFTVDHLEAIAWWMRHAKDLPTRTPAAAKTASPGDAVAPSTD